MLKFMKDFRADEDGAVTVDWVVLTAAVVGLAAAAASEIRGGKNELTNQTADYLNRQDPSTGPTIHDLVGGGTGYTGG